jgi:hypothetical protein
VNRNILKIAFFALIMVFFASFISISITKLAVDQPKDKIIIKNSRIMIKGSAPGAVSVLINNTKISPESDGSFDAAAMLRAGKNVVQVTANYKDGTKST